MKPPSLGYRPRPRIASDDWRFSFHKEELRKLWLPLLAADLGLDKDKLIELAERDKFNCSICLGPISRPQPFVSGSALRGIICVYCANALKKTEGDLVRLANHHRFSTKTLGRRVANFDIRRIEREARFRRLIDLSSTPGPFG